MVVIKFRSLTVFEWQGTGQKKATDCPMTDQNQKPFRLFLLRHARAGWAKPGDKDFDRSLDRNGEIEAERVGNLAAANFEMPKYALCSPAIRCRQTFEIFQNCQNSKMETSFSSLLFTGHIEDYMSEVMNYSAKGSLLLIGHNPTIEYMLTVFLGETATKIAIPNGYPTAGLAVLDIKTDLSPNSGTLIALLSP